jgi:hypothetical protein
MEKDQAYSLRQCVLSSVGAIVGFGIACYFVFSFTVEKQALQNITEVGVGLARNAAFSIAPMIAFDGGRDLGKTLKSLLVNPDIDYVVVWDENQKMLASRNPASPPPFGFGKDLQTHVAGGDVHVKLGVVDGGKVWGYLQIGLSLQRTNHDLHLALAAILTLSLVFISVLAWFLVHTVTTSIGKVIGILNLEADELGSAVSQIASNSRAIAEGAGQQVSSVERTSGSLRQMAAMTKQNAVHVQEAKVAGNQARVAAHAGSEDINALTSAMDNVREASRSVSKIMGLIDDIAFETNILALNAAIEAARAGAAGLSFAVVADAVRHLAKRSAEAACETAEKITDSIKKSDQSMLICAEVTKRLAYIAGSPAR